MDNLLEKYRTPIASFCFGVLCASVLFWIYFEENNISPTDQKVEILRADEDGEDSVQMRTFISGAVNKPGIYQADNDLYNYIEENIGFSDDADLEQFKQILEECGSTSCIFVPASCEGSLDIDGSGVVSGVDSIDGLISLNNATQQELESLPGIGPVYAERIIKGRPYSNIIEITKIKGIGDKTFQKVKPLLSL